MRDRRTDRPVVNLKALFNIRSDNVAMRHLLLFFALASGIAVSASAQVTRCSTYGGQTTCRTISDEDRMDGDGTMIGTFNRLFGGNPHKKAGKLLAKGDCEGAKKVALEAGDLDLAKQVVEFCTVKRQ